MRAVTSVNDLQLCLLTRMPVLASFIDSRLLDFRPASGSTTLCINRMLCTLHVIIPQREESVFGEIHTNHAFGMP